MNDYLEGDVVYLIMTINIQMEYCIMELTMN